MNAPRLANWQQARTNQPRLPFIAVVAIPVLTPCLAARRLRPGSPRWGPVYPRALAFPPAGGQRAAAQNPSTVRWQSGPGPARRDFATRQGAAPLPRSAGCDFAGPAA